MFGQCQSTMDPWEALQRFEAGILALATSTHCFGVRVWLSQQTSHLLTPRRIPPSQSTPLAGDSASKLQSPGEQRGQEATSIGLGAARQSWKQVGFGVRQM